MISSFYMLITNWHIDEIFYLLSTTYHITYEYSISLYIKYSYIFLCIFLY